MKLQLFRFFKLQEILHQNRFGTPTTHAAAQVFRIFMYSLCIVIHKIITCVLISNGNVLRARKLNCKKLLLCCLCYVAGKFSTLQVKSVT